ncbi:hypothetical protein EDB80DRAFT_828332 [Ilyonectria destructans]|nr:hypothetical protein EDB80DRAFT_828332 [Ilyonectria destructans]
MVSQTIAVIGGLDADLIMIASRIPNGGESVLVNEYLEALGGKGANSAIATYRTCHKRSLVNKRTTENGVLEKPTDGDHAVIATNEQQLAIDSSGEDNIQVKMIGAVGDNRYGKEFIVELNKEGIDASGVVTVPNTRSSVCFVMVEYSTRENRCLFMLGATATWKKEDFINAEQLGGGIRPDLVVA